jgi:hypothetical protein
VSSWCSWRRSVTASRPTSPAPCSIATARSP